MSRKKRDPDRTAQQEKNGRGGDGETGRRGDGEISEPQASVGRKPHERTEKEGELQTAGHEEPQRSPRFARLLLVLATLLLAGWITFLVVLAVLAARPKV